MPPRARHRFHRLTGNVVGGQQPRDSGESAHDPLEARTVMRFHILAARVMTTPNAER